MALPTNWGGWMAFCSAKPKCLESKMVHRVEPWIARAPRRARELMVSYLDIQMS